MTDSIRILLVSKSAATREWWADLLSHDDLLVTTAGELNEGELVDVILADQQLPAALERLVREGAMIIQIGNNGPSELTLDADATEREIRLACRLEAQISRLRRERAAGEGERELLADLTLTDPLTGLRNRRAWDMVAQELANSPEGVCLMLVDLDRFKELNDRQGHALGDAVLRAAATALQRSLRPGDFVVRLGGDEFAVLIPGLQVEPAGRIIERLRGAVLSGSEAAGRKITCSVGFAVSETAACLARLFEAADRALREAKANGRDQVVRARFEP